MREGGHTSFHEGTTEHRADDLRGARAGRRRQRMYSQTVHETVIAPGGDHDEAVGTARFDASGDAADMPSWSQLVAQHGDRVYRLAFRLCGNAHDAEDITQEAFIRVFRSLDKYKPGTFEGWMHRIVTNLFLDMARRRSRIRFEALPEDAERVPGRERSPEQVLSEETFDPVLQTALANLSPEFRAAVVLCDIEDLSYEEVGRILGVKMGTVRSRIHRGRSALRAELEAAGVTGVQQGID
ncbi:RNA polymerase sigma-70 factor (ECF subfamily) [Dietzia sp. 2505]